MVHLSLLLLLLLFLLLQATRLDPQKCSHNQNSAPKMLHAFFIIFFLSKNIFLFPNTNLDDIEAGTILGSSTYTNPNQILRVFLQGHCSRYCRNSPKTEIKTKTPANCSFHHNRDIDKRNQNCVRYLFPKYRVSD